jgi:hypothetical protein
MLTFGASAVAVSYANFMKSAAQRLGPTTLWEAGNMARTLFWQWFSE